MTETLKNHDIDIQNNMQEWIKNQIEQTYQETDSGLKSLKDKITNDTLENELTMEHVKGVLKNALDKFSQGKSFKDVYGGTTIAWPEGMWAGLVLNVQIALKKLGKDVGAIDWRYGKRTKDAVIAFQKEYNLNPDGRAGKLTLTKILEQLGEPQKAQEEVKTDEEIKKPEQETQKPEQETIILDKTPEEKIDHLNKIQENFTLEPAAYINIQSVEQKNQTFVMKAKVYDKDVSIVFDKEYKNPILEIGKDVFNLDITSDQWGKSKLFIINKTTQQTEEVDETIERLYQNAEFIFEGNNIQQQDNLMEIFNKNKVTNFSLQLRNDIPNKETKVDVNWTDKEKIDLKEDLNPSNSNSINLHFSKIAGIDVNFILTIAKSDNANGKKFTLTSPTIIRENNWIEETTNNIVSNNINAILEEHKTPLNVEYENNQYDYQKRTLEILQEKYTENKNKFGSDQKFKTFENLINDKINKIKVTLNNYKTNPSTIAIWAPKKNREDASLMVDWMIREFLNRSWLESGQPSMTDIINEKNLPLGRFFLS
jgi:hypothetical protein